MMLRPAISRADLVACYRQDPDCLDHCAGLFGFERRPRAEVPEAVEAEATAKVVMKPAAAEPTDLTDRATLWQHTRTEPHFVPATASRTPEPRSVQEGVLALARAHHDGKDKRAFLLEECCHLADLGVVPRKLTRVARTLFRELGRYLGRQYVRETEYPEPVWVAGWVVRAVTRLPPRVRAWAEMSDCWRLADELLRRRAPRPSGARRRRELSNLDGPDRR